jgi:hypothetical protein
MDVNTVREKNMRRYCRTANRSLRFHEDIKKTLVPAIAVEAEMAVGVSIACLAQRPGKLF